MNLTKIKTQLSYHLVAQSSLNAKQVDRMYQLLVSNYDFVNRKQFEKDLSNKSWIGLLQDQTEKIEGFTTFSVNPNGTGTDTYNIIFSGDTIVSPEHWGSLEFVRGSIHTGGRIVASDPNKKWYWFLISKGHRTYMYLPLFFGEYYPALEPNLEEELRLKRKLNQMASQLFGSCWHPDKGLIIFPNNMGQMKTELAEASWKRKHKSHVAFFLEKNPRFFKGEELACIAELSPENMKGSARKYFLEGMEVPV